jgi:hypothetical protein
MPDNNHDGGSTPGRGSLFKRLALEMTLREVAPLDELVFYVERCAGQLEDVVGGTGRCTLTVHPVWDSDRNRYYEVHVRFVGSEGYAEVRHLDGDLFFAVQDAFDAIRRRLRRRRGSGVHPRPQGATEEELDLSAVVAESEAG